MAQKVSKRVKTLSGFMKWIEQFNDGQYLFRGVSKHTYKLEASAYRRLPEADRNNSSRLLKINRELINKARLLGHDRKDGHYLSDLELLAELQHFGAATCLIDFTRNAQIALWFACQQSSTGEANGKVFAVRSDDPAIFRTITPELVTQKNIEYFFQEDELGRAPLYQWQPKQQNNRVIAQQSIFIFGGSEIVAAAECVILKSSKSEILDFLNNSAGITEASIYPDFDGFARQHAQNKPYIEPNVQGYLQRGTEAHLEGKLDGAIIYYTEVISLQPDAPILSEAYTKRGNAYRAKDEVDRAIDDYTKAIELEPNNAEVYRLRGNAYANERDFDNVIEDYSNVIELEPDDAQVYNRRGSAYAQRGEFDDAIKDYTISIQLKPDHTYAYNGRGRAYTRKGEFDNAIRDYTNSIQLKPDHTYAYNGRGDAYSKKGEFDNAIKDYTTAINLKPDHFYAYGGRGRVYTAKGEFDNAIKDYTTAIELESDDPYAYNGQGIVYTANGKFDDAIRNYNIAIQLRPDYAKAYYNRGKARLYLQEWEEAKSDLTIAEDKGVDITTEFHNDYASVEDFEQKTGIQLPPDITEMLTRQ